MGGENKIVTYQLFYLSVYLCCTIAYRAGVVIAICNGCGSNHLIADNLGMIGLDIDTNIEDYFKKIGMDDSVKRVNNDVFFLENLLRIDTTGGSLVGDDGRPVLE